MKSNSQKLFSEFSGITKEEWINKIRSDLKDPRAMERLVWKTEEGFDVDPFYRPEDLASLEYLENLWTLRKPATAPNGWIICPEVSPGKDPVLAGEQLMEALKGGAQAVRICFTGSSEYGLNELRTMLHQTPLAETELFFQGGMRIDALYDHLCELGREHNIQPDHFRGGLGADPLGIMIASGTPIASMENLGMLVRKVNLQSPSLKTIDVSGGLFQNAGSTLTEELAFTLAMANEYMALLTDRGIEPVAIQHSMRLSFTSGPNYFLEIAKLRAARILWSLLTEAYGMKHADSSIDIHATTARWNQTLYDPYVNMLRGTSEAMAAVIGGADYLTVLPFNIASGKITALADRIARNVPIILREEGYLDKVADPASGAYYLEKLTHELGARSWELFQEVEARGGFRKASESGWIQQQVLHSAKGKQQQISNGAKKLIGTNAFPNPNETIPLKAKKVKPQQPEDTPLDHLHPFRPSSTLEEIRMKVEQWSPRPRAFLLKIGNPNWAISRAAFASNFFASGGYEIMDPPLFISTKDGVSEVLKSHPEIIVLCGSDEDVVEKAAEIISSLPPSAFIVVAGDPRNIGKDLEAHGISQFIHRRSPLVETLQVINSIILK